MAQRINNNSVLGTTGIIYEAKVQHLQGLNLSVIDNGGGSTITFSSGSDGVTYGGTPVVYKPDGTLLGGATATAKGRYFVDLRGVTYVKIAVTTYVSGKVITDVDEAASAVVGRITTAIKTGLTALGSSAATALPIVAWFNHFSTVAASTGAALPGTVPAGESVVIRNDGANALTVYPPTGKTVHAYNSLSLSAGAVGRFVSDGNGNFWVLGN
jgi:hypothetical protein